MSIVTLKFGNDQEHDFILQNIVGDGDCGYTAFANWWNLKIEKAFEREDSLSLRRKVAAYINEQWEADWTDADGNTIKLKEAVKREILDREQSHKDFSRYQVNFDLEKEDDETIKEKYCNFIAEPKKLWINDFEFSILEKIFNKQVFVVNSAGKPFRGDLSGAAPEDNFYTVYNGVHYNLLINIKQYIADTWLKLIRYNTTVLNLVAFYTGKSIDWLQDRKNKITEELLTFLNTQSKEKLTEFYKELSQFFRKDQNTQEKAFASARGNKEQNIFEETFKFLFNNTSSDNFFGNFTVFCARIKLLWHKVVVLFNPGIVLEDFETSGKYEEYGKYKDVFEIAKEPGRQFYRKVLLEVDGGEKLTDKQFLNKFLHSLKHDTQKLFSKNGHSICSALEEVVLGDKNSFISNIEHNLQEAFKHYRNDYPEKKLLIDTAVAYASNLRKKIDDLKNIITDSDETDENKNKLFQALQYDRLKLIHFTLKMQAFSKRETLTNKKSFTDNFKKYLNKLSAVKDIIAGTRQASTVDDNYKPSGIFNLFESQKSGNKLNSQSKYDEFLAEIKKERGKELKNKTAYLLQQAEQLSSNIDQFRNDFQAYEYQYYHNYNLENQLQSLYDKVDELRKQINNIAIIDNDLSTLKYDEVLSLIALKQSMLSRFQENLAQWYNVYAGLSRPGNVAEDERQSEMGAEHDDEQQYSEQYDDEPQEVPRYAPSGP